MTSEQISKIAETKFNDMNSCDIDHACRIIAGTARSMGIEIKGGSRLCDPPRDDGGFPATSYLHANPRSDRPPKS